MSGGWGEGESVGDDEDSDLPNGGHIYLGDGHRLELNKDRFIELLHTQAVVDAISTRAKDMTEEANSLVAMDPRAVERLSNGEDAYKFSVQNRSDTTRARARVYPANILGALDNFHHGTLDKVREVFPSDPIPNYGPAVDSETSDNNTFGPEHESEIGHALNDVEDL